MMTVAILPNPGKLGFLMQHKEQLHKTIARGRRQGLSSAISWVSLLLFLNGLAEVILN